MLPLAGPANRQGRVAAESIAGRTTQFRGIQATAVVGVLGLTVASTGASEKGLRRAGVMSFEKVYLHPGHHAGYEVRAARGWRGQTPRGIDGLRDVPVDPRGRMTTES